MVPVLEPGDAIGNEVRTLRRMLRERGVESEVFTADTREGDATLPLADLLTMRAPDCVLYHFAVASRLTSVLARVAAPVALLYHNVTPREHFVGVDRAHYDGCGQALDELRAMRPHTRVAIGRSEFTRHELEAIGFARTGVVPVLVDAPPVLPNRAESAADRHRQPPLFVVVGRVAPNKRVEDAIRLLHAYRTGVDPGARLLVVGDYSRFPPYRLALERLVDQLGVGGVELVGRVDPAGLAEVWSNASMLWSMSVHEGFGVTLVEAMRADVPILARAATAVPETLGEAGIRFDRFDAPLLAEVSARVLSDPAIRCRQVALGRSRAASFSPERTFASLADRMGEIGVRVP